MNAQLLHGNETVKTVLGWNPGLRLDFYATVGGCLVYSTCKQAQKLCFGTKLIKPKSCFLVLVIIKILKVSFSN